MAKENYPLIRQYELIDKTVEYSLSNVKKAYLPQFNLSAQATYQSAAADFPDELKRLFKDFTNVYMIEVTEKNKYKVIKQSKDELFQNKKEIIGKDNIDIL